MIKIPLYQYICGEGHITEDICLFSDKQKDMDCEECGKIAVESFARRPVTGNVETTRFSRAMGVAPHQIEAAMRRYPGSVYNKKGHLRIQGRTEKKVRMKQRDYVEY